MPYSPVYSSPLIQYTPDEPNAQFAVPAGYTAVIRQISVVQNIGEYLASVLIQDSIDAEALTIAQMADIGAGSMWQQEGRWVVPGLGYITLNLSSVGSEVSAYVGGYLLQNVID